MIGLCHTCMGSHRETTLDKKGHPICEPCKNPPPPSDVPHHLRPESGDNEFDGINYCTVCDMEIFSIDTVCRECSRAAMAACALCEPEAVMMPP